MSLELQDIFNQFGKAYREIHPLPLHQLKTMEAIERCRTSALGGHIDVCDSCGYEVLYPGKGSFPQISR